MVVETRYHVNFYDTDLMAVVHHSNYIRWFEIGRVEFLRALGLTLGEIMDAGFVFPITDISAKYHSPAYFDDNLIIAVTPIALTRVKMAFDYEIFRESDRTLLVTGHSQNVFTDKATGKVSRLPVEMYKRLEKGLES